MSYFRRIIIIVALLPVFSTYGGEKSSIICTIPPIASLVKMVVGDLGEVSSLQKNHACPHHYSLKPSDHISLNKANYIIYIDKNFEVNFYNNVKKIKNIKKLQISDFKDINIIDKNYHIWLDLENAKAILGGVKEFFIKENFPEEIIEKNYLISLKKLERMKNFTNFSKVIFIGPSLLYLSLQDNVENIYIPQINSLKKLRQTKKAINRINPKCIIYDDSVKLSLNNEKYEGKIIKLSTENWQDYHSDDREYYINYLKNIYENFSPCLNENVK